MAPGNKRKRGDARYAYDEDHPNRQSPHRPQNLALANAHQQTNSPRGGRRGSRSGGRGGHNGPHSPSVAQASPTAMAPPTNAYQASRSAQPTPSTPISQKDQSLAKPGPSPEVPEINEYLTAERLANWNADNRNSIIQTAITLQRNGDMETLAGVFYEINDACINQYMKPAELGSLIRDILSAPCSDDTIDPTSLFLDSLSTVAAIDENPPYTQIRQMLWVSDIDLNKMRCELENDMLIGLELVRQSFPKVGVRKATNALYRQTNYNLLREESEGFSKLMTEYFTTVSSEDPTGEAVSAAYQRVNAFIGAFDLDVGRVLDLTLDVFANLLVKHGKFFVKYLRASSWWPELQGIEGIEWEEPEIQTLPGWALPDAPSFRYSEQEKEHQLELRECRDVKFWKHMSTLNDEKDRIKAFFELGARRVTRDHRVPDVEDDSKSSRKTATQKWAEEWIAKTGTLPPPGNDVAAQLLGFKLRFYASDARDASDVLPDNLIYLAALLIKIGFISIMDLYPHLYPADDDMKAHREKLTKEKKAREDERKGKSSNALTNAGALSDDTLPAPAVTRLREAESKVPVKSDSERSTPAKSDEESKASNLPEPVDQKVALLRSLLCIGAIPEALFILGRYPWLLDVYPDLHAYIFRLAHHSIHKVYESSRPVPLDKVPSVPKGSNSWDYIPRRTLRWAKLDQKDAGDGIDYRFYWEDWMDNVPVCQSVDDVFLLCSSLLSFVGPECGRDILLITKLARIGKKSVSDNSSEENMKRWSNFSTTFLAPALTFTGQNPGVVNEVWELFKRFDTATRYGIYKHWFNSTKGVMRAAFMEVQVETKTLLNRVASTNTRPMGRAMAKLAYACPGTVFQQTLRQGQSYINMINALVECSRYLTNLGYDCLTWTLVNTLVNNDKATLQGDGMLVKSWLKNTAIFIGKVYRRYGLMDPTPVLQFVQHQLARPEGEMYMLTVLEQLISTMGGIGLSGALTEAQVLALSAGSSLRAYTLEHHLGDKRHEAGPPARRLLRCLKESGLMPQILIALAQQVENYLFREELFEVPDKVVFTNFDHFRSNFAQYLEFLRDNLTPVEFDEQVPGVVELISEFNLEPSLAFQICRDSIAVGIKSARSKLSFTKDATDDDVEMGETEARLTTNGVAARVTEVIENATARPQDIDMKDDAAVESTDITGSTAEGSSTTTSPSSSCSNHEVDTIAQQLRVAMPERFGDHSFLDFFVTFWGLSLKDVYVPEGEELKMQYEDAKKHVHNMAVTASSDSRYRHDPSILRQAKENVSKLDEEYQETSKMARLTQSGLQKEMLQWFSGVSADQSKSLHDLLIQDCFLPRLRMSLQDAQFASTMLFFMHRTGVPGFRLLKFLDRLFISERLSPIIGSMSEDEVKCFGRFINDILRELERWHVDENVFDQLAYGQNKRLRGFAMAAEPNSPLMSYEMFLKVHCKWHKELFKALKDSLENKHYSELRNSINVLKAVSPAFPKIEHMAVELRTIIERYAKDDERDDVKVAANSLLYEFKRSAKLWKTEAAFTVCHVKNVLRSLANA
jgi:THO complex subunit 2